MIDSNDIALVRSLYDSRVVSATAAPRSACGKINPHVTRFLLADGRGVCVFSADPIYYEARDGSWRPLSEIAFYGTRGNLVLLPGALSRCSMRFMRWLSQREKVLGHNLGIGHPREVYAGVQIGDLAVAHSRDIFPDPTNTVTIVGHVGNFASTWAAAHDAATGTGIGGTGTIASVNIQETVGSTEFSIGRAFILFDTAILSPVNILSATLSCFLVAVVVDEDNDGDDWIGIVQSSPASNNALTTADFDQCGAITNPTEGANRVDLSSMTLNAYNMWTLNATGLGWLNKAGITKLGQREGHDALNAPIATNSQNQLNYHGRNGANPPKLIVTYLSPMAFSVVAS